MAYVVWSSLEDKYHASRALVIGDVRPLKQFIRESFIGAGWNTGLRLPSELVPKEARMQRGEKFYDVYNNFQIAPGVSKRFKDLVESIEPDVHQFFPIEVFRQDGVTPYGEPFWLMNICTRVDAICIEKSDMYQRGEDRGPLYDGDYPWYGRYVIKSMDYGTGPPRITIYKDRVVGRSMWCDYRHPVAHFFSEALMVGMRERGMEGYAIKHVVNEI
ncbi:MAG: imm11 family protein [Aestuariivirga sp.]